VWAAFRPPGVLGVFSAQRAGEYDYVMGWRITTALAVGLGGCSIVLTACGATTKTVVVGAKAPAPGATQPSTSAPATTPSTTGAATAPSTSTAPSPTHTRTAPEPAFVEHEAKGGALAGAEAVLRARGFTASSTADYHEGQALRVLVGTRTGSSDGHDQQAFFFVNGRYIGTDASQPSATVSVVGQSDTEVTLAYRLYRENDPLCCPSGGEARVRFQLNNGMLTALDPIPPVRSGSGLSRQ
jgi:LppP/LprE lipoprotein